MCKIPNPATTFVVKSEPILNTRISVFQHFLQLPPPLGPASTSVALIWYLSQNWSSLVSYLLMNHSLLNSNKSPTGCNNFLVYYPDVYLQLNMFLAFSRPSSGAQWLQWQPMVLPSYRGDSRAVFVVGPANPSTNTARLSPRYEGKTRGCHCSHWALDDGLENARNMFNCK